MFVLPWHVASLWNQILQAKWTLLHHVHSTPGLTALTALSPAGKWVHVKETTTIGEGKLYAPGNLRATFDNPQYEQVSMAQSWTWEKRQRARLA